MEVDVEFPEKMDVGETGADVIAGELDGPSASLEGAEELPTTSVPELFPVAALELTASVLELAGEAVTGVTPSSTLVVCVKVLTSVCWTTRMTLTPTVVVYIVSTI